MGRQGDGAAIELDLANERKLRMGFDVVDDQTIVARADRREPISTGGEDDAVDSLLPGRGAIRLAQDPGAGDGLELLLGLAVEPRRRRLPGGRARRSAPASKTEILPQDCGFCRASRLAGARRGFRCRPRFERCCERCRKKRRTSTAIENRLMAT